ncbi:MAG: hypothetical protein HOO96_09820 [Polyangiaceae bacterium]|nr:hypothetical protein [Polyangiaceae bacterium]
MNLRLAILVTSCALGSACSSDGPATTSDAGSGASADATAQGDAGADSTVDPDGGPVGPRSCPAWPAVPDAKCTGAPAGYPLTKIDGMPTSAAGETIDGKYITGDLQIRHDNVTVTNTRVVGHVIMNGHKGLTLRDVDIGPDACPARNNGGVRAIDGNSGYTLVRVHIQHNADDLLAIGGPDPVVIRDSLLDRTCFYPGDHLDAVQWYDPGAVGNVVIEHSSIDARPDNDTDRGNAAVFWADGAGAGTTLTLFHSRLAGGNVTTALYDAVAGSKVVLDVHDNVYVKGSYTVAPCSFGGSIKSIAFDGTSGVKFAGNTFDDATPVTCN